MRAYLPRRVDESREGGTILSIFISSETLHSLLASEDRALSLYRLISYNRDLGYNPLILNNIKSMEVSDLTEALLPWRDIISTPYLLTLEISLPPEELRD